jgi:hypothetical protein
MTAHRCCEGGRPLTLRAVLHTGGASGFFTLHCVRHSESEGLSVTRLLTGVIVGRDLPIMPGMQIPFAGANMNNSIRFGSIWGKERAIIACQVSRGAALPIIVSDTHSNCFVCCQTSKSALFARE